MTWVSSNTILTTTTAATCPDLIIPGGAENRVAVDMFLTKVRAIVRG
ncbi:MAG: hypothetical protein ACE5HT_07050 [Gemmatimonadales bacterium]